MAFMIAFCNLSLFKTAAVIENSYHQDVYAEISANNYEYTVDYKITDDNKIILNLTLLKEPSNTLSLNNHPAISVDVPDNYFIAFDHKKTYPYVDSEELANGRLLYNIFLPLNKETATVILFPLDEDIDNDLIILYDYNKDPLLITEFKYLNIGDINGDGFINAIDASQLLSYYAYTSTGGTLGLREYMSIG